MGRFLKELKKSWNKQMIDYGFKQPSATGTGDGKDHKLDPDIITWEPIYEKFRSRMGRDPYSMRELKDWWEQY